MASPSLFKNPRIQVGNISESIDEYDDYFYGVQYSPPQIVEYSIKDPMNVGMFKKYQISTRGDPLIGTKQISVNENFILHLVFHPQTQEQRIRVYDRWTTNMNSAKFEIPLTSDSPLNFFGFPNQFCDMIVFRDERTVNITEIKEHALILNSTDV
jgi:hypothetical protein